MKNKIEQYLFVYDEKEGFFPERWKVVDNDDQSVAALDINGHIKKSELDSLRKLLEQRYSDERFLITSAYGNTWNAIENNYHGLFYDHFSSIETKREGGTPGKNIIKQDEIKQFIILFLSTLKSSHS